jgi:hypothetical protein
MKHYKNNNMQRMLEKATTVGDVSADELDPETASLRDAWLAFGQMLETAQPDSDALLLSPDATTCAPLLPGEAPIYAPLPLRERAERSHALRSWYVRAGSLLTVSLLIAVSTAWTLRVSSQQANPNAESQTASATSPSKQPRVQTPANANGPQWDDSLDEPLAQVSWQMACIQQNQTLRTDAFGIIEYKLGQLSKAIQADSPGN